MLVEFTSSTLVVSGDDWNFDETGVVEKITLVNERDTIFEAGILPSAVLKCQSAMQSKSKVL